MVPLSINYTVVLEGPGKHKMQHSKISQYAESYDGAYTTLKATREETSRSGMAEGGQEEAELKAGRSEKQTRNNIERRHGEVCLRFVL